MPNYGDLYPEHWAMDKEVEDRHKEISRRIQIWPTDANDKVCNCMSHSLFIHKTILTVLKLVRWWSTWYVFVGPTYQVLFQYGQQIRNERIHRTLYLIASCQELHIMKDLYWCQFLIAVWLPPGAPPVCDPPVQPWPQPPGDQKCHDQPPVQVCHSAAEIYQVT